MHFITIYIVIFNRSIFEQPLPSIVSFVKRSRPRALNAWQDRNGNMASRFVRDHTVFRPAMHSNNIEGVGTIEIGY